MNCPFCKAEMLRNDYSSYYSYYCDADVCVVGGDMPRYTVIYNKFPDRLYCTALMLGHFYIKQNFELKTTEISRLEACFIFGTILIPCIIPLDFNNLEGTLTRIKRLIIFS